MEENSVVSLTCACCFGDCRGRQWYNRDTGYGVCWRCIVWQRSRGIGEKEIKDCYGIEGVHFNVKETDES